MNKTLAIIALAALLLTNNSHSQTATFGGHTYAALPAMSLTEAREAAATLGGHLVYVDSEDEYTFIDQNFVKRGTGWWWTGMKQNGGRWINDNRSFNHYVPSTHWLNTIQTNPVGPGAVIVLGKLQFSYRSTKWVTKLYQFSAEFASYQVCRSIVEIE